MSGDGAVRRPRPARVRHAKGPWVPTGCMVAPLDLLGLLVLVFANAALAALGTRFFRVRLHTRWGSALYVATVVPVVLFLTTLVVGGVLRLGPNLGSPGAVVGIAVLLPLALGVAFDYFWMPAPSELDLPEAAGGKRRPQESRRWR